jgi:hypothetical protein
MTLGLPVYVFPNVPFLWVSPWEKEYGLRRGDLGMAG